MLPWSFSEEAAAEKHMAQLQHNMWVVASRAAALSVITGGKVGAAADRRMLESREAARLNIDFGFGVSPWELV